MRAQRRPRPAEFRLIGGVQNDLQLGPAQLPGSGVETSIASPRNHRSGWHPCRMTTSKNLEPLPIPDERVWSSIGMVCGSELHGGYQSRVFAAALHGDPVVVKLTDSRLADYSFGRRLKVVAALAEIDGSVVGPVPVKSALVAPLGAWLAAVYPFVSGRTPEVSVERDVRRMASALASLHRSLDQLGAVDLPPVAALTNAELPAGADGFGRSQLLHGDFSYANTLFEGDKVRILDFDDCGYGPVEFEIGNTLYMVLFDAAMSSEMLRYERFRAWFIDEYMSASGRVVFDETLEMAIGLRVQALGRWVDRPETAPIGIRTASPAWRDSLRAFVQSRAGH